MSATPKRLAIIIVNYNSAPEILACLRSVAKNSRAEECEVIVADNGSTDNSIELIRAQHSEARILLLQRNCGFASACNAAMREMNGMNVLLLNPDTEVGCDAIDALMTALEAHPAWGMAGARMVKSSGRPYRAARRLPAIRDLVFSTVGLSRLFARSRYFNSYLYGERPIDSLDEVEQIEGSCLMISARARAAVGDLDERFFIFFEEVDWCKRVRDAGFELHIVQSAEVVHHISTTMSRHYEASREYHARSAMHYFLKHHGEQSYKDLRRAMNRALTVRAGILAVPALLNIGGARRRLAGTLRERRVYQRGLPG